MDKNLIMDARTETQDEHLYFTTPSTSLLLYRYSGSKNVRIFIAFYVIALSYVRTWKYNYTIGRYWTGLHLSFILAPYSVEI